MLIKPMTRPYFARIITQGKTIRVEIWKVQLRLRGETIDKLVECHCIDGLPYHLVVDEVYNHVKALNLPFKSTPYRPVGR